MNDKTTKAAWTLEQWVADAHERLDQFAATWVAEHARDPAMWPMEMPPGEWDEQHRFMEAI